MDKIEDPWHSRPIDVHRWSDHTEVVQFVDRVWEDGSLPQDFVVKGPGPKPKMAFRKQLRVLILDLCKVPFSAQSCCSCETRLMAAPSPSTTLVRSAALRASEAGRAGSGPSRRMQ
jgi:hypothetical protein